MKKLSILLSLFIAAVLAATNVKTPKDEASLLLLSNIEALAAGEHGDNTICLGTGTVDCPFSHKKVEFVGSSYSLEDE